MDPLADVIRQRREELGLGQAQLAEQLGVSQQTVSRWEAGEGLPRPSRIEELAHRLRLDRERLLRAAGYLPPREDQLDADDPQRLLALLSDLPEPVLIQLIDRAWHELVARRGAAPTHE